jgi:hypothetical protein
VMGVQSKQIISIKGHPNKDWKVVDLHHLLQCFKGERHLLNKSMLVAKFAMVLFKKVLEYIHLGVEHGTNQ